MTRPTTEEIRKMKNDLWKELDKKKNKVERDRIAYGILLLQWVLDERP